VRSKIGAGRTSNRMKGYWVKVSNSKRRDEASRGEFFDGGNSEKRQINLTGDTGKDWSNLERIQSGRVGSALCMAENGADPKPIGHKKQSVRGGGETEAY